MKEIDVHYLIEKQDLEIKQRIWKKVIKRMPEINRQISDRGNMVSKKERLKCNKKRQTNKFQQ